MHGYYHHQAQRQAVQFGGEVVCVNPPGANLCPRLAWNSSQHPAGQGEVWVIKDVEELKVGAEFEVLRQGATWLRTNHSRRRLDHETDFSVYCLPDG